MDTLFHGAVGELENSRNQIETTHHEGIIQAADHRQKPDEGGFNSWVTVEEPFVDMETEWSTVAKVVPFKVLEDKRKPAVNIIHVGTRNKKERFLIHLLIWYTYRIICTNTIKRWSL